MIGYVRDCRIPGCPGPWFWAETLEEDTVIPWGTDQPSDGDSVAVLRVDQGDTVGIKSQGNSEDHILCTVLDIHQTSKYYWLSVYDLYSAMTL